MDIDEAAAAAPPSQTAASRFSLNMIDPSLYPGGPPELEMMMDDDEDEVASNISADSDALELRAEVERFDLQQEAFVARQRAEASGIPYQPPPPQKAGGKGGRKSKSRKSTGPRKAAKLPPDIQFRMSLANEAFQQKDYDKTIAHLSEIIRINSEVFNAWMLLSTVHETLGNREQAIWCRISAAHLTPRDVPQWIATAEYALECLEDVDDDAATTADGSTSGSGNTPAKDEVLQRAYACYTQALETDRANITARTGRADVIMMQGNASKALAEYQKALSYRPWNIRTVRNIADVALDVKDRRKGADIARAAYRRLVDHLRAGGSFEAEEGWFEWSDLRIYLEFFTILEQWREGAQELKEISRWLLGRRDEVYWDQWVDDDREWDITDDRRIAVPEFEPARFPQESYGQGLPVDLRAKLYVYRGKLGFEYEANLHLQLLDPAKEEDFMDFPDCLKDIAVALLDRGRADDAILYLDLYRNIAMTTGEITLDADFSVCQGRYHMARGEKSAAEECFIAAIEDDEDHIEARVQLANMYEGEEMQEGREEAFLLVREAMNLEARRGDGSGRRRAPYGPRKPREGKPRPRKPRDPNKKSNYVPRRLINAEKRRQQELEMTAEAAKNFQRLREVQDNALAGDEQAKGVWMKAAKHLIDDFRSYKQFYPWEKYIKFLGYAANVQGQAAVPARNMKLAAMEERLRQNLAPAEGQEQVIRIPDQHREGICGLPRRRGTPSSGQRPESTFLIHVAWALVRRLRRRRRNVRRHRPLLHARLHAPAQIPTACSRPCARVCQTPVSWYTSGPAQKFILRQIKTMDNIVMRRENTTTHPNNPTFLLSNTHPLNPSTTTTTAAPDSDIALDVALLTIYGHILFTTTSYTYALSYFARAASLDPSNPLINLSTGLAYVHYALKRQATNRQYLLTQGFAFLFRYYDDRLRLHPRTEKGGVDKGRVDGRGVVGVRQEAHFNIARAYSLVGLAGLAVEYYKKVLAEGGTGDGDGEGGEGVGGMGSEDLRVEAAYNIRTLCYLLGDVEGARGVAGEFLVLE
ncbi:hypothetical protein CHGG_02988 [Chaetomium globosum CBS 148.51]|uniref:TPR-like protein n=1 Tax=Chaetomium globosum (strain ATCC 6205 / CBS 148.51 / DSM 1962 / NBRC 6347 / NRRL 1970) TaxID=306901 RepID=Q2H9W6_CHAGB|nr:uncharacterized protein CHGG_02988 [Chaetomium globosum CBS 148.51]EAQ91053.1 hypothetical protein CHGG_02988 [Chaetomium globosum CBS 148.51]